jgi:hypothetical protein
VLIIDSSKENVKPNGCVKLQCAVNSASVYIVCIACEQSIVFASKLLVLVVPEERRAQLEF